MPSLTFELVGPPKLNTRSSYSRSSMTLIAPDRSRSTAVNHDQSLNKSSKGAHGARPSHVLRVGTRRRAPLGLGMGEAPGSVVARGSTILTVAVLCFRCGERECD